jgi:hypothetical protein
MELIKQRFDQGVFNVDDIRDAFRTLDKAMKENDINSWTLSDRANLLYIYEGMERTFVKELAAGLSEYWKIRYTHLEESIKRKNHGAYLFCYCSSPDWIRDSVSMLDRIYEDPLYQQTHPNPLSQYKNLVETVEVTKETRCVNPFVANSCLSIPRVLLSNDGEAWKRLVSRTPMILPTC